jgi:hypothetical protein
MFHPSTDAFIGREVYIAHARREALRSGMGARHTRLDATGPDLMKWSCACAVAAIWLLQQQSGIAVQSTSGPTDVRPVTVPAFDAESGLQWSSSREEYDAARADERYSFEQFTYESEGLTVGAYLYRPRKRSASPLPVIVYNRGSYTRPTGFAGEMLVMANRYGQAGFVVIAPH